MSATYYKFTNEDGSSCNGGSGKWVRNRWRSVKGGIVPCSNGLHLCREQDLLHWFGPKLWIAEVDVGGEIVEQSDKFVVRRARVVEHVETWNERTARLFACDCAQKAMDLVGSPDPRSLTAIEVARRYAQGKATRDELAAARAAARDVALDATLDAAWAAARDAALDAAWAAARAAAWAAWAAAGTTAWDAAAVAVADAADAARKWQTERLMQYLRGVAK